VFFVDLPTSQEKRSIWEIWRKRYAIPEEQETPGDENWSGSDIRTCCRMADLMTCTLQEASEFVTPVAKADPAGLAELRAWAKGSAVPAGDNLEATGSAPVLLVGP
jgi:hypothetical protein